MTEEIIPHRGSPNKETKDRAIKIKLLDGTQATGQVNINRKPQYDRVSDVLATKQEQFLILSDVTIYHAYSAEAEKQQAFFINKAHIIWAKPDENQKITEKDKNE